MIVRSILGPIFGVIMPTALTGIFGGIVLAFGRALGETMALAMLVGNANHISVSLFSPANTLAALLANNFPEARPKDVSVLMYAAMVLLGGMLAKNASALRVGAASLTGSVSFFLISNFAVWAGSIMYPHTAAGLAACYTAALPFFRNTAASDLFFSLAMFGTPVLLHALSEWLNKANNQAAAA